jgi:hypothetical protein
MGSGLKSDPGAEEIVLPDPAWANGLPRPVLFFILVATVGGTSVGVFALVFGLFFWPSGAVLPPIAPVGSGVILLAGTAWGGLLFRRTLRRRATSIRVGDTGVQAVLADGQAIDCRWSEPGFAMDLTVVRDSGTPPLERRSLRWRARPYAFAPGVTESGMTRLLDQARSHGLSVQEQALGSRSGGPTVYRIRGASGGG